MVNKSDEDEYEKEEDLDKKSGEDGGIEDSEKEGEQKEPKETEDNKKPKITREIKPEIQEKVETSNLEELTEQPETVETDNFSEFMLASSTEMPTLTLSSTSVEPPEAVKPENLEQSAASSIGAPLPPPTAEEMGYEARVYNEPDYTGSMSEERTLADMRRRITTKPIEEIRDVQPRIEIEDFNQLRGMRGEDRGRTERMIEEYAVIEPERRSEERKLPFEQQIKYRKLKRER